MNLLCDKGSFIEYDAFTEHDCSDFGMEKQKARQNFEDYHFQSLNFQFETVRIILLTCAGYDNILQLHLH